MRESNLNTESKKVDTPQKRARISKISFWMGILAAFPYVCLILFYLPIDNRDILLIPALLGLFLGFISGFPFGLAGVITGIISLTRRSKTKKDVVFAIMGILLSIGGFIGHVWYFDTCQFCQ